MQEDNLDAVKLSAAVIVLWFFINAIFYVGCIIFLIGLSFIKWEDMFPTTLYDLLPVVRIIALGATMLTAIMLSWDWKGFKAAVLRDY